MIYLPFNTKYIYPHTQCCGCYLASAVLSIEEPMVSKLDKFFCWKCIKHGFPKQINAFVFLPGYVEHVTKDVMGDLMYFLRVRLERKTHTRQQVSHNLNRIKLEVMNLERWDDANSPGNMVGTLHEIRQILQEMEPGLERAATTTRELDKYV